MQNRYDNGVYDRIGGHVVDRPVSYTLVDDSTTTDGSGGDVVVAAGLGVDVTGGDVDDEYMASTRRAAWVVVKSTNAGHSGWSGDLSFSSGTSSSGNSGLLATARAPRLWARRARYRWAWEVATAASAATCT